MTLNKNKTLNNKQSISQLQRDIIQNGIFLDSMFFVLLIIGTNNEKKIGSGKTSDYKIWHYYELVKILSRANKIYITPYIESEISNHILNRLDNGLRDQMEWSNISTMLKYFLKSDTIEQPVDIAELANQDEESKLIFDFGITDTSILQKAAEKRFAVFTDDTNLYNMLRSLGLSVVCRDELCKIT